MSDVRKPQQGDKCRITFDAVYDRPDFNWDIFDVGAGRTTSVLRDGATVEVLVRAEDPKVGEIRREDHDGGYSLWQSVEGPEGQGLWLCTFSTAFGNRGETLLWQQVADLPVIGSVPGTPAADAEKRQRDVTRELHEAAREFDALPGYGSLRDETSTRRLFQSDGPEPPRDVKVVEVIAYSPDGYRYLRRVGSGWLWSQLAHEQEPEVGATPNDWASAVRAYPGPFREVR